MPTSLQDQLTEYCNTRHLVQAERLAVGEAPSPSFRLRNEEKICPSRTGSGICSQSHRPPCRSADARPSPLASNSFADAGALMRDELEPGATSTPTPRAGVLMLHRPQIERQSDSCRPARCHPVLTTPAAVAEKFAWSIPSPSITAYYLHPRQHPFVNGEKSWRCPSRDLCISPLDAQSSPRPRRFAFAPSHRKPSAAFGHR